MTKLEEVAWRIYAADPAANGVVYADWLAAGGMEMARAAIEAMRVPNEAMIQAGDYDQTGGPTPTMLQVAFPLMIDAILKEEGNG